MTSADRAAVAYFKNALLAHERGNGIVVERVMNDFSGPISGTGATRGEAIQALRSNIQANESAFQTEANNQEARYDTVTDHGRRQLQGPSEGFPGGDDVELLCTPCEETLELSAGPHHLGDESYSGTINCCFQTPAAGTNIQITFQLFECQADASAAEIVYTHRGVQAENRILVNNQQIGTTPRSPSDGSTAVERLSFDPALLQTDENILEVITESPPTGRDIDDFELSNIRLEFTL